MITKKEVLAAYRDEICKKVDQIDPDQELDWRSMFIGFAIGKGFSIVGATDPDLYEEAFLLEG